MALSYVESTVTGATTDFTVPFAYLEKSHVTITLNGVPKAVTWTSAQAITITPAPVGKLRIQRNTPNTEQLVDFIDGSVLDEDLLSLMAQQLFYCLQEALDNAGTATTDSAAALVTAAQAVLTANEGKTLATTANATSNTAKTTAASAVTTANAADTKANTAITTANGAVTTANATTAVAAGAVTTANTAKTTADAAKATADGIAGQVTAANTTANQAKTIAQGIEAKADNALSVANGINAKAQSALDASAAATTTANTAKTTADSAKTTANGIDAKATTALATANAAKTAADSAKATAEGVDAKATQAQTDAAAARQAAEGSSEAFDQATALIAGKAKAGANSDITALTGLTTALSIAQGGTGSKTAVDARLALGLEKSETTLDNTLGRLMRIGDHGFGAGLVISPGDNLSNVFATSVTGMTSNTVGGPTGATSGSMCFTMVYNSDTTQQLVIARTADQMWLRRKVSSNWQPWVEVSVGAGTASKGVLTTSKTDTTIGRVVKVGDFGLGEVVTITTGDADTLTTSATYWINTATNTPGNVAGYLRVDKASADFVLQEFTAGVAGGKSRRLRVAGTWQPWKKVLNEDDLGGLPVASTHPWAVSRATIPAGWIPNDGQVLNRADWPQLWALAAASAVTDAVWLAAPYDQRGKYSSGDGSTTFRMPDTNGKAADGLTIAAMVLRGDGKLSAGTPGLHQADQVQPFNLGRADVAGWQLKENAGYPSANGDGSVLRGAYFTAPGNTSMNQIAVAPLGAYGTPRVGIETRGSNQTVTWCTVGASKAANLGTVDVTALATTVSQQSGQIASKVETTDKRISTAWVNFNGVGTPVIRDSYNVASVTRIAAGLFTVTFTAAFANANYAYFVGTDGSSGSFGYYADTATANSIRILLKRTDNGGAVDNSVVSLTINGGK